MDTWYLESHHALLTRKQSVQNGIFRFTFYQHSSPDLKSMFFAMIYKLVSLFLQKMNALAWYSP